LFRSWIERLCHEIHNRGFMGIIMLTGHYSLNQQITVRETAARLSIRMGIPVYGSAEFALACDIGYWGDHGGIGETSILNYIDPTLVELDRVDASTEYNREMIEKAKTNLGKTYIDAIVRRISSLAVHMPKMTQEEIDNMAAAELAVVHAQVRGKERWDRYDKLFDAFDWKGISEMAAADTSI
ncbi:MAG TPA: creatininase family protein, partial [Clostridia bacterium]|nr:creatininase family protein [Clostridia bacterium]